MPDAPEKLRLGENHRRVLSVVLRGVEATCEGILQDLDRKPRLLQRLADDLAPGQQTKLRKLADHLRAEIERFEKEVTLDPACHSRRRAIASRISSAQIDLEEVRDSGLRGYGMLPGDMERKLGEKLDRLIALLETMRSVVERA